MSQAERKRAARALRKKLRAQLQEARRAKKARRPPSLLLVHRQKRRRRVALALLALLLALLLLEHCTCTPPPQAPASEAPAAPPPPKVPVVVKQKPRPPRPPRPTGRVAAKPRPAFEGELAPPPPWLDALRLQVAARAPRLAACFEGAERPGALLFAAAIHPKDGAVSDATLEPTLQATPPQDAIRCALDVLEAPRYRLDAEGTALPQRVRLLVEF